LAIDDDSVTILSEGDFRSHGESSQSKSELGLHEFFEITLDCGAAVSGDLKSGRGGNFEVVENCTDETTIPQ
jgi:hypothetical protein